MTSGSVGRQLEAFAQCWLAMYVVGGGQFEQIGEDLTSLFKLQNHAIPHNKLRAHLKPPGTKINPMLLPIPWLLLKKKKKKGQKRKFLPYYHLEVLVAQQVLIAVSETHIGEAKVFNAFNTLRSSPHNVP